jgi:Cu-Zn family superoxide dismutase
MPLSFQLLLLLPLLGVLTACPRQEPGEEGEPSPADTAPAEAPDTGMAPAGGAADSAHATMRDAQGKEVGEIVLAQTPEGVTLRGDITGLPAGVHGFHIHEVGRCDAPTFESAGEHFNPTGRKHGLQNPEGPHAGDLPNLEVAEGGVATVEVTAANVTLAEGQTSLFDADGSAIVVHADRDDEKTNPSGNSGNRIACGVVTGHSAAQM